MPGREDGFTLVETLVGLVVFVCAAVVLMNEFSIGFEAVRVMESERRAVAQARSVIATLGNLEPLKAGKHLLGESDGFSWTADVSQYDPSSTEFATDDASSSVGAVWIDLKVHWRDGGWNTRQLRLKTLKLVPSKTKSE